MKRNDNFERAFTPIPQKCYNAMMQAAHSVQEEPIVKKKLSAILVFAIVTVLLAGVALAAVTLQGTGKQILQNEQTEGYYENWTAETKAVLVKELAELEYIEMTPGVKRLIADEVTSTDEIHRIADEAMVAFTGMDVSEISFLIIMEAAWGPFDTWSAEEKAWESQLQIDLGLHRDGLTLYVLPTGDIDKQTAEQMAREAIAKGLGVDVSALDGYAFEVSFQVPEFSAAIGSTQPYWSIFFERPADIPEENALIDRFSLFIHPQTGEFLEPVDEVIALRQEQEALRTARNSDPLMLEMSTYETEHQMGATPYGWTEKDFAAWNTLFHDRAVQKLQEHPDYFSPYRTAMLAYTYGLPNDNAITREAAQAIAEDAIVSQIGRQPEEVSFFTHRLVIMYDVTDPETPLWKFYFQMPSQYDQDDEFAQKVLAYYGSDGERLPNIKVEINAYTGELVQAFPVDFAYDYDADPTGDGLPDFFIEKYLQVY